MLSCFVHSCNDRTKEAKLTEKIYSFRPELLVADMDVSRHIFSSRYIHFYPFLQQVIRDGGSISQKIMLPTSKFYELHRSKWLFILCFLLSLATSNDFPYPYPLSWKIKHELTLRKTKMHTAFRHI